jgi:hypothetical protein
LERADLYFNKSKNKKGNYFEELEIDEERREKSFS